MSDDHAAPPGCAALFARQDSTIQSTAPLRKLPNISISEKLHGMLQQIRKQQVR